MKLPTLRSPARIALAAGLCSCAVAPAAAFADPAASFYPGAPSGGQAACAPAPTSKAFAKLDNDQNDYSVAPGGTFEAGAGGWTLAGGARVVSGNENRGVEAGTHSLQMPIGSVATSPKFCVDETYPHFRFAYKIDSVGMSGFVAAIIYSRDGVPTQTQFVSSEKLSIVPSAWSLTPASPLASKIPLNGGTATVQIRLMSVAVTGRADLLVSTLARNANALANIGVSVDSVMVDPARRS